MTPLKIGLLGCGTVGRGLIELIERNGDLVAGRTGLKPTVECALVRDGAKPRGTNGLPLTTDADAFFARDYDVVVELLGGIEPARSHLLRAIAAGKPVVTANKALLAAHGPELFAAAAAQGVRVGFEASVCGGVPVIRALRSGLLANRIESFLGILNGTSNFVLTRLEEGVDPPRALALARGRGLTEADPTLDLDGTDAAQKAQVLASIAFGARAAPLFVAGIVGIDAEDLAAAAEVGATIRHVAGAERTPRGLRLRAEPLVVPRAHPLASVRDENNALLVRGDAAGEILLAGRGAGALPTAGAVLADIQEVAAGGGLGLDPGDAVVDSDPSLVAPFYLRFPIRDVPGVIGLVATALGNRSISIQRAAATLVPGRPGHGHVRVFVHPCDEAALRRTVAELARLPVVTGPPVVVRVLEGG